MAREQDGAAPEGPCTGAAEARRRRLGGGLYLYRVNEEVRKLLERGGYLADIGKDNMFPVKARAVGFIYPRIDTEICRTCPSKKPCLDYAISIREPHGIWGGLNEAERKGLMIQAV